MFFDLRTKYKHEHRHTWWSQNKIQTRSLDWNRSMHSSFIWWCTQEKKCTYQTETSVRSTRLEQNAWAKNTTWPASWSHSSSFFFWNETLINYNTREQSDAAKIRPKPCITSSYYRQLTYSLSDAHLHHHRAHLDHLHYQWLWAVQSQEKKRIFQPRLSCLTNSKNQLLLYIVYKQLVKALISVTTKYCEQMGTHVEN